MSNQKNEKKDISKELSNVSLNFETFFGIIRRYFVLLISIILFSTLCGIGLGKIFDKTKYTASTTVLFKASLNNEVLTTTNNDTSLAKLILPDTIKVLKSDDIISKTNSLYKDYAFSKGFSPSYISGGNISFSNTSSSLILKISYNDASREQAVEKLSMYINVITNRNGDLTTSEYESFLKPINANLMELKLVQNDISVSSSSSFMKYVLFALLAGVVIALCIAILIFYMDTSLRTKEDLEKITGIPLLSYIDDTELYNSAKSSSGHSSSHSKRRK
ncbi:MAG: Wzz/FepE/Etk N-terminal domain-containing protein [Clostridia bacterium]|nr:Wzz/FepE/Etk N-terminal domain-containing protein [Clostridia bacterium]